MQQIALVTGGGSGIGRGIALALARRGVNLALLGRRLEPLHAVAEESRSHGVRAVAFPVDLTHRDELEATFAQVRRELGPLSLLINNAGRLAGGALMAQTPDTIERAVALNTTAPLLLTRLALPDLISNGGAVVLVGSMTSFMPLPFASLYSGTKMGMRGFGTALRYELEPLGVHLLLAYPPMTDTAMVQGMAEAVGLPRSRFARLHAPDAVGERIVAALLARKPEVVWRGGELFAARLYHWVPAPMRTILRLERQRFARMMTAPDRSAK
ncbi:MAG TPA: SDR family NAD(P)-dependent oxidoreductase [Roseiflexaceae bacterium]|jgi:short-subunit dehydrogenase|nr:SDR family NAD(P)-dependent oxidoreductase [Roseiflexaceae bacterium]